MFAIRVIWSFMFISSCVSDQAPHFVFFMVDDLGWNDISAHGSEIQTPNIDQMMEDGVELTQYYTAPVCGPSRMQFMSGKYLTTLGMQHGNIAPCRPSGLPLTTNTIADELKPFGYKNHILGKWHQGFFTEEHLPTRRGFDSFYGCLQGGADHYLHTHGYRGKPYYDWYRNESRDLMSNNTYDTFLLRDEAMNIINDHVNSGSSDSLFLYIAFLAAHAPNQSPDSYSKAYRRNSANRDRRDYAGMVSALDESVGDVIAHLKATGLYDNSVIILVSDNGGNARKGASNWPYRGNKSTFYEGGVKAVAAVSGGRVERGGVISDKLMYVTDWMPTLYHLASSGQTLNGVDGVNQWDVINEDEDAIREEIIFNVDPMELLDGDSSSDNFNTRQQAVIRHGDYKLMTGNHEWNDIIPNPITDPDNYTRYVKVVSTDVPDVQLFNVIDDPTESRDLSSELPTVRDFLLDRLNSHSINAPTPFYPRSVSDCDPINFNGIWSPYQ